MPPRTAAFMGSDVGFPVRLDPRNGDFQITEGTFNNVSVALSYLAEQWSIRPGQNFKETSNLVAESMYNILLTPERSWSEIPWYGSRMSYAIFEPNTIEFQLLYSTYLSASTIRWEKRAQIPQSSIEWGAFGLVTDQGASQLTAMVQFITQQTPKNLVLPFVTIRQVRTQEYLANIIDANGYDLPSRYYNRTAYHTPDNAYSFLRLNKQQLLIPPAPDDGSYLVKPTDTWMLIAWALYGEIRYWYYLFLAYVQDNEGETTTRDMMFPDNKPPAGTYIRYPSTSRILILQSRRGS